MSAFFDWVSIFYNVSKMLIFVYKGVRFGKPNTFINGFEP